jgi:acetylornithine deacetylase
MIDAMLADGPRPEMVVVGEPSMMQVITAHKGTALIKVTATGHSVHSSQWDRGVSAVAAAARVITWLDDQTRANQAAADPALDMDPPFTTLHCGLVEGGTAANIVSRSCSFMTDIRTVPGENLEMWLERLDDFLARDIVPAMKAVHPDAGIAVERLADVPPLSQESDGPAERLVRRLTGDNGVHMVVYGTEAGQFQARGLSTVVCGPGSIDQAHQPDEFIDIAQLAAGEDFVARLIGDLAR